MENQVEEQATSLLDQMMNLESANPPEKYFHAPREEDRRRVEVKNRKRFEVNKMWDIHHEIIRRIVIGQSNKDIATSLGVSDVMVSYTRNSKVCQMEIEAKRKERDAKAIDIAAEIRDFAIQPLEVLKDIIRDNGENHSISLVAKTSESWLDRAGYAAPKRFEGVVAHLTADEIKQIKEEATKDAAESGVIIEAEGEIVPASGEIIKAQAEVIENQQKIIDIRKED